jgi:hypothetical protein
MKEGTMPIVHRTSNIVKDYYNPASVEPDPALARGRMIVAALTQTNAADDLSGSSYHLIDLPSDCILDSATQFDVEDWGFAGIRVGTKTDIDALINQTKATANVVTPVAKFGANHGKALWQVLGMAADPGGTIGLYAHGPANAVGAGTMLAEIHYRYR